MITFNDYRDSQGNWHSVKYEDGIVVYDIIVQHSYTSDSDTVSGGSGSNIRTSAYDSIANDTLRSGLSNYSQTNIAFVGTNLDDSINNYNSQNTLYGGAGNDTIYNGWFAGETFIKAGSGNDVILNYAGDTIIKSGSGDDNIKSSGHSTVIGGSGNDNINITGYSGGVYTDEVLVDAGDDDDYIVLEGFDNSTIIAGAGNDTIRSYDGNTTTNFRNESNTIYGGDGDDYIYGGGHKYGSTGETLIGGKGNDTIHVGNSSDGRATVIYSEGDGDDVIEDGIAFLSWKSSYTNPKNTIIIAGGSSYSTTKSGSDLVVNVGSGSITLKEIGELVGGFYASYLNIGGESFLVNEPTVDGSDDNADNVVIGGDSTETVISPESTPTISPYDTVNTGSSAVQNVSADDAGNIYIILEDDILTVEGGEGKTIKFKNDFISGDPLDVQFAHSLKINEEAKFYWGIGEDATLALNDYAPTAINVSLNNSNFNDTTNPAFYGDIKTIDARGYTGYALLSGKDNIDNVIYGNETSCAMWGGNGGNDTLIGGNGSDLFWYVNGGGIDIVQNANSNDTVRFDGITLDELVGGGGQIIGNDVKVELKSGGSLTVENARNSEVVFDFNDTKYAVNSSTGEWEFR